MDELSFLSCVLLSLLLHVLNVTSPTALKARRWRRGFFSNYLGKVSVDMGANGQSPVMTKVSLVRKCNVKLGPLS